MGYRTSMGIHNRGSTAIDAGFVEMLAQGENARFAEVGQKSGGLLYGVCTVSRDFQSDCAKLFFRNDLVMVEAAGVELFHRL
jgi:hypothetical protein